MTGVWSDRTHRVSGGLITVCVVVLLGLAAGSAADEGHALFGPDAPDAPTACSVDELQVTPTLDFSADDQGYVISTVTFGALPAACAGQDYHLTFAAPSGESILELHGVLGEAAGTVTIPEVSRPSAEAVATTTLTVPGTTAS